MSSRRVSFETLNAYVDGELDAAAAAKVAAAVAEDAALARELSALSRLRSTVAESIHVPPLSVAAPPRSAARGMGVAAGIALTVFVAGSILVAKLYQTAGTDWLARAWHVHRGWSGGAVSAQDRAALQVARDTQGLPEAYVPDLSASRLTLVHAAVVPFTGDRRMLLAGYRGTRGCRISLLVFSAPPPTGSVTRSGPSTTQATKPTPGGSAASGTSFSRTAWTRAVSGCSPQAFEAPAASTCPSMTRPASPCAGAATPARPASPDGRMPGGPQAPASE